MSRPDHEDQLPEVLRATDALLRRIRFQPRQSLEPELAGRLVRSEKPARVGVTAWRQWWPAGLVAGLAVGFLALLVILHRASTIDRCCYDLDGGGAVDDGVLVVAERDGRIRRLSVYEDRDRSETFTAADIIRLTRAGVPEPEQSIPPGFTTIRRCCQDLDGGGPADDVIMTVATPPDRVLAAAIYELR